VPEAIPEDMTELYDAEVPRVDLVGKGANGMPLLIAKQNQAGVLEPAFIRDLIAKGGARDAPGPEEGQDLVTVTASPGAIAALIHGAPVRKAAPEPLSGIEKADLSTKALNDLPDSAFAFIEPGGKKDAEGKTTPRSLRHFAIHDKAHADNAAARIAQGAKFGEQAKAKVEAAQRRFGEDVAKATEESAMDETMDPGVLLAEPGVAAPGMATVPGSPAWEAVDAATARKWTAILARARAALELMADRENLEAASADPSDAESACDLQDAACAVDYAISILAPFAVDEQAEADCCDDMNMIGKALGGFDTGPLEVIESLAPVRKAGRVLSAANEAAIRGAVESLQKVLASLPAAPTAEPDGGRAVAKTANEEPDMPEATPTDEATAASGQAPALGTQSLPAEHVAGEPVTDMSKSAVDEIVAKLAAALAPAASETIVAGAVAKAEKTPQVAIYDADGHLVGTVDPAEITMLAPAKAPAAEPDDEGEETGGGDAEAQAPAPEAAAAAPPTDLAPAPAAEAGTPADAVPSDGLAKQAAAQAADTDTQPVLKGSDITSLVKAALDDYSATQAALVKELKDQNAELKEYAGTLAKRLAAVENAPAVMAIASHGAIPPKHLLRGQDHGATADLTEGQVLRKRLSASDDAQEQKEIATQLNTLAIEKLKEMHAARAPQLP
jgi:hypothetical protein